MAEPLQPAQLVELAKCFICLDAVQVEAVKTYLLAVLAGGSTDPAVLMAEAKCFMCIQPDVAVHLQNYLLCQAVENCAGGGVDAEILTDDHGNPITDDQGQPVQIQT